MGQPSAPVGQVSDIAGGFPGEELHQSDSQRPPLQLSRVWRHVGIRLPIKLFDDGLGAPDGL